MGKEQDPYMKLELPYFKRMVLLFSRKSPNFTSVVDRDEVKFDQIDPFYLKSSRRLLKTTNKYPNCGLELNKL